MFYRLQRLTSFSLAALLLLASVAQGAAPAPQIPDEWPDWLKKEMSSGRKRRKKTKPITAGAVQMEVFGKLAQTEDVDGTTYFAIDIGAAAPVSCWVYAQPQYMATTVKLLTDELMAQNAQANGAPIKQQVVYYHDLGVLSDLPYLATEWLWVIDINGESSIGLMKMRAAQKENTLFVCAHDQVGYRETFADLFEQVMTSATWPHDYQKPYLREVLTYSVAGRPAGIAWNELRLDEEGDTVARVETAMALQVDDFTLTTSDSLEVEFSTPEGEVINAYSESAENAEITTALSLNTNESDSWIVTGRMQGKEVTFDLGSDVQPYSVLGEIRTVRAILNDKGRDSATMSGWVPDADPSAFITAEFKLDERGKSKSTATYTIGPMAITGEFENGSGSMLNGAMAIGGLDMRIERVYGEGEVP